MTDDASPQKDEKGRFLPGNSGFGGRPKGSRNKLGEAFLKALADDFEKNGADAIEQTRITKPEVYVKVVASLLPKQIEIKEGAFDGLGDDELAALVAAARSALAVAGGGGAGIDDAAQPQPAGAVRTIQ